LTGYLGDRRLVIWDIFPNPGTKANSLPRESSIESISATNVPSGIAETWCVTFANALRSIAVHQEVANSILVADSRGSVYLVDWEMCRTSSYSRGDQIVMEFIEPHTLAQLIFSPAPSYTGFVSWKPSDSNAILATFGERWAVWEETNGSRPIATGSTFNGGAQTVRWCPTDPNLFALSPLRKSNGAVLHIHNVGFINSSPTQFEIVPSPHFVHDFDWLGTTFKKSPLVAVAIGKLVHILRIGETSDEEAEA